MLHVKNDILIKASFYIIFLIMFPRENVFVPLKIAFSNGFKKKEITILTTGLLKNLKNFEIFIITDSDQRTIHFSDEVGKVIFCADHLLGGKKITN